MHENCQYDLIDLNGMRMAHKMKKQHAEREKEMKIKKNAHNCDPMVW